MNTFDVIDNSIYQHEIRLHEPERREGGVGNGLKKRLRNIAQPQSLRQRRPRRWGSVDGLFVFQAVPQKSAEPLDTQKIIDNQLGKRNLNDMQRAELALEKEKIVAERARLNQKTSTGGATPQLVTNSSQAGIKTRAVIAKTARVGEGTISRVKRIKSSPVKELARMTRSSEVSINAAATVGEHGSVPAAGDGLSAWMKWDDLISRWSGLHFPQ